MGDRGPFRFGRPAWDKAGAEMVAEVGPYEFMKVAHAQRRAFEPCLSRLSRSHETVAEATADPLIAGFLEKLWAEIIPPSLPRRA